MRYVDMKLTKAGMELANTLYDGNGRVLLGKGTVLTNEYITKLNKRGFIGVYIQDELSEDIVINEIISPELRNKGVKALKTKNLDMARSVAIEIVDEILSSPVVTLEMVDLRNFDDCTYRHSVNVAVISTIVGINMGMNRFMLEELSIAAILHDIGKMLISSDIINKPGKLTDEEFDIIKEHPRLGYDFLSEKMDISARIRTSILSHHENEDGTGYPNGMTGKSIYVYAKVIHVADVFDALTSRRPYKQPFSRLEAAEYLMGACDRLFDRHVVVAFLRSVTIYPKGTVVTLSDGRVGMTISSGVNSLRPVVRLANKEEIDLNDMNLYRNVTIKEDCVKQIQ